MNFFPFSNFDTLPKLNYITSTWSSVSLQTYTFSNVSLGGEGLCVVAISAEISGFAGRFINPVTINGQSATGNTSVSQLNSTGVTTAIYRLRQTALTGTVSVTFLTSAVARCYIAIYNINDVISDTPITTLNDTKSSGTTASLTFNNLQEDTIGVFAYTIGLDTVSGITWSGANLNINQSLGTGQTRVNNASLRTTATGSRTVSVVHTNSTQPKVLLGQVWR